MDTTTLRSLALSVTLTAAGCTIGTDAGHATDGVRAADGTYNLFAATAAPANASEADSSAVELGVRFRVDVDGTLESLRFYKSPGNTGVHTGHVWCRNGGLLAGVTFTGETASGWQTARIDPPLTLHAGETYVASYHTSTGHYADDAHGFARGIDTGPLHALADQSSAHNGVYHYGASAYPTDSWQASNYWVDVAFRPANTAVDAGAADASHATDAATTHDASMPVDAATTHDASTPDAGAPVAFPDATHTGVPAGTVLRNVPGELTSGTGWHWDARGWVHVDAAGTTLVGLDIHGSVAGATDGIVVRNTRIRCTNEHTWCLTMGLHASVVDTEIGGGEDGVTTQGAPAILSGGSDAGNLIQRANIHHVVHGPHIDGGTTLVDSYIHELPMGDRGFDDAHTDGVFISTGWHTVIRHNRFECGNSAEIFVQDYDDDAMGVGDLTIEGNRFVDVARNGQNSSWAVACENKDIRGPIVVRDNTFDRGWSVGPMEVPTGATVTGNVFTDGTAASAYVQPVVY